MNRDVLHAQAAVSEHHVRQAASFRLVGIQALAKPAFSGGAQALASTLRFVRCHQLHALRIGLVKRTILAIRAHEVGQFITGLALEIGGQRAIPFGFDDRARSHRYHGQRSNQVGVAGAEYQNLGPFDERTIIVVTVEAHWPHDATAVERHQRAGRDGHLRLSEVGIFGCPDDAATGQLHRPLADRNGFATLLGLHRHPTIRLQCLRGFGSIARVRLPLAARTHAHQHFTLRAAAARLGAIHRLARNRLRLCNGALRRHTGQDADQSAIQHFHLHVHYRTSRPSRRPTGAVGSSLISTRSRLRASAPSLAAIASYTALARRMPNATL